MPKQRERKAHIWKKHKDNWYVEEQWCADALFRDVYFEGAIHDPCCGMGTIPMAAMKAKIKWTAADIKQRTPSLIAPTKLFRVTRYQDDRRCYDNIVTNPPFDDINKEPWPFIEWAVKHAQHKVAVLVPFKWFAGDKRSRFLETKQITQVLILTPRPSMPPGDALLAMRKRGEKPGGGKEDFAWVIFEELGECWECGHANAGPIMGWIHRDQNA